MNNNLFQKTVTEGAIGFLEDNQVPEGSTLDYKLDLNLCDKGKKELLKDICGFANAQGGHLIIGVKESEDGKLLFNGVEHVDKFNDEFFSTISGLVRNSIEPPYPFISHDKISYKGKIFFVITAPKSIYSPHRISQGKERAFYMRVNNITTMMSLNEIKNSFLVGHYYAEWAMDFIRKRILSILGNIELPVSLRGKARAVVHIVSESSFNDNIYFPIKDYLNDNNHVFYTDNFNPLLSNSISTKLNLDGFVKYAVVSEEGVRSYVQVFRNGAIESVASHCFAEDRQLIPHVKIEKEIFEKVLNYMGSLSKSPSYFPCYLSVSLLNTKGFRMLTDIRSDSSEIECISRDNLITEPTRIEEYDLSKIKKAVVQQFDLFWNECNKEKSPNFNDVCEWIGK